VGTEPWGRKKRPITDVISTAVGKEETAVRLQTIRDEEPYGGSNVAYREQSLVYGTVNNFISVTMMTRATEEYVTSAVTSCNRRVAGSGVAMRSGTRRTVSLQ
jgi:hypothetical protein